VLGSDSYRFINDALTERLREIDEQAQTANRTDTAAASRCHLSPVLRR
jgi:hypothetical protein